ncbi:uncharacterized protein BDZ99DRAFT_536817 [Mytilinidion resinicola]|uniref:Uncharacterized protein n=1 Tax=Mytilinidion resinicola TaxID=574789 RepID=A0A6A6YEY2_9PEZI|nr:uncharacterized protein BDZ99DRAFT_536817 [Mytilinidion resinicola]KAF2807351.1 hypothetical protein BDZ99DRAFT_536817 [Mytilinidion resinicola]
MSLRSRPNTPTNVNGAKYLEGCRAADHLNLTYEWIVLSQDPDMKEIWADLYAVAQPKWDTSFEELFHFIHAPETTANDHIRTRIRQLNAWRSQEPRAPFPPQHTLGPWISPEEDPDWTEFCAGPMEGDPNEALPDLARQLVGRIGVLKWLQKLEADPPEEYLIAPTVVPRVLQRATGEGSPRLRIGSPTPRSPFEPMGSWSRLPLPKRP